jgi:pyruvate decarboxylase
MFFISPEIVQRLRMSQNGSGVRLVEVLMGREDVQGALLYLLNKQLDQEKD